MSIQKCRRENIYQVGYMGPSFVNSKNVADDTKGTKDYIFHALDQQNYKTKILLPYNFKYVFMSWLVLFMCNMMLGLISCIDICSASTGFFLLSDWTVAASMLWIREGKMQQSTKTSSTCWISNVLTFIIFLLSFPLMYSNSNNCYC